MANKFIRYNTGSAYYEYDTSAAQDGSGPWLILPIDASQISQGTINAARLPSGVVNLSPTRGDLIYANSSPAWAKRAVGTGLLKADGTDVSGWSKLLDVDVDAAAAIAWTKLSKSGSSLADLATRSAGDLSSGNIANARMPTTQVDLPGQFKSKAYDNTGQTINNNATTAVVFDSNSYDTGSVHSTSVNKTRFTVPTNGDGLWLIIGQVSLLATAAARFIVSIRRNGTTTIGSLDLTLPAAGVDQVLSVAAFDVVVATDYWEILSYQNTGAGVSTNWGALGITFGAVAKLS